jgi:hypothetical protein
MVLAAKNAVETIGVPTIMIETMLAPITPLPLLKQHLLASPVKTMGVVLTRTVETRDMVQGR